VGVGTYWFEEECDQGGPVEDMRVGGSWGKASDSVRQREGRCRDEVAEERIGSKMAGPGGCKRQYSGQTGVSRGSPFAKQDHGRCLPEMICFVNTQLRGQRRMAGARSGGRTGGQAMLESGAVKPERARHDSLGLLYGPPG
jgi:hypothetical protein